MFTDAPTQTELTCTSLRSHAHRPPGWEGACPTCGVAPPESLDPGATDAQHSLMTSSLSSRTAFRADAILCAQERLAAVAAGSGLSIAQLSSLHARYRNELLKQDAALTSMGRLRDAMEGAVGQLLLGQGEASSSMASREPDVAAAAAAIARALGGL